MTRTTADRKIAARCIRLARSHGNSSQTATGTARTLIAAYNIATDLYVETDNDNACANIRSAMMIIEKPRALRAA